MKMKYGINDKVPIAKAIPLALQHVFTIFTGTMAGNIMLATGAGLDVNDTALIIQCGMLISCVASLIQSLGVFGLPIGSKLPIITAGSYTLITPLVAFAADPEIGLSGAFGAAFAGSIALFLLGPLVIKYLHKYFTPVITGSVVLSVGMCLLTTAYGIMVNYAPYDPDVKKYFVIAIVIAVLTLVLDSFAKGFIQSLSVLIAMSGVASRYVTALGSVIFGFLAFFPKFSQILALLPSPVLGGVLLVMFGTITSSGIRVIGMGNLTKRNMTIVAMAIAVGIGGNFAVEAEYLSFLPSTITTLCTGIPGTALTALILNFVLPKTEEDRKWEAEYAASLVEK
ncbi:MAG: uracil-xanthine permease [Lachnospiraceae bacterium]|nr:uracil-xanthine permease [Lachnospiraceae bacterium]